MNYANSNPKTCPNGHQARDAAARFCITCGMPLVANAAPQPAVVGSFQQQPVNQRPQNNGANYQQPNLDQIPPANFYPVQPNFNQYPPQPVNQNFQMPVYSHPVCRTCGGDGRGLSDKMLICPECRWLRPLAPGYAIDCSAFQWAEDGKAMNTLRSITPLNSAAQSISNKVGRRWIESAFNAVRLSEKQLPDIYFPAVRAARILGMTRMPDVYVSGDCLWDCHTYGSDDDAFIIIGSALASNFRGIDLLFVLAREMGHARAGHALWKSVIRFLVGEQTHRKGVFSNGILGALNPSTLIEGAIEVPLLAWARQAEITADRAGLLTVGSEEVARRVLLTWSLKSAFLYKKINVAAWLEQQASADDSMVKLSELATSSTPYITRRLALITQFAASPELERWRSVINQYAPLPQPKSAAPQNQLPKPAQDVLANQNAAVPKKAQAAASNEIKMKCAACSAPMRIPQKVFAGKTQVNVRCPNAKCGKISTLKIKQNSAKPETMLNKKERNLMCEND
ncbi:MAG: M48 family metallopeptidase [Acidobacteriota bacterium]|nr:M48 family metallopeptidase [Acidobacteriota bacterium]